MILLSLTLDNWTNFPELIEKSEIHSPRTSFLLVIVYGALKYLPVFAGTLILITIILSPIIKSRK